MSQKIITTEMWLIFNPGPLTRDSLAFLFCINKGFLRNGLKI